MAPEDRLKRLEHLFAVVRRYEILLVSHRCDKALGRLTTPNPCVTKDDAEQIWEVARRLNEVTKAEGELIEALIECDPTFHEDFFAVTVVGKSQAGNNKEQ